MRSEDLDPMTSERGGGKRRINPGDEFHGPLRCF